MRIAVSLRKQHVAPVFDIAREMLLADLGAGPWVHKQKENLMNGKNQGRQTGGGRGQGGGGRGRGGRGLGGGRRPQPTTGTPGTQADEFCVCLQCGQRTPHERGVPCTTQKCPQCGGTMARA